MNHLKCNILIFYCLDIRIQVFELRNWMNENKLKFNCINQNLFVFQDGLAALSDVHPDSEEFKALPMEVQHEVLSEVKERRKYHSLSRVAKMPEVCCVLLGVIWCVSIIIVCHVCHHGTSYVCNYDLCHHGTSYVCNYDVCHWALLVSCACHHDGYMTE